MMHTFGPIRLVATVTLVVAMVLTPAVGGVGSAQEPAVREHGYIELPDGVRLKYTVWLPSADGDFPVLMQYEGYNAGSFPDRANEAFVQEMLADGYAVLGVSLRGSACSGGVFDPFDPVWGQDGAFAVDWAAEQPWSNGRIGMFSLSFAGIMQLWTAANQPEHLAAVAPGQVVADIYRDVAYPGGVYNALFPTVWGAALHQTWAEPAPQAVQDGDTECLVNIAAHPAMNAPYSIGLQATQHPYADHWMTERSVHRLLDRIEVPFLGMQSWQDEQTGPRGGYHLDELDPERTWFVSANGPHAMYVQSPRFRALLHEFFDHFLKGEDNGFEATPRIRVWHEVDPRSANPRWVSAYDRWPIPRTPMRLHLREGGVLSDEEPSGGAPGTTYAYPIPGPAAVLGIPPESWTFAPVSEEGSIAFTTPGLPESLTFVGEGSADLWVSTTGTDVDLQVTVTEVRPDGQEVYVQRGWLRLSHRALDEVRSTELRPYHPHTEAAQLGTPTGELMLARVEILPFAHTFRAGSAIRLWIDTPSPTGLWGFQPIATPAQVTVHHDADRPSSLVLGHVKAEAPPNTPACGELSAQPCRPDPLGIPDGEGPQPPANRDGEPAADTTVDPPRSGAPLPATGGGAAAAGLAVLLFVSLRTSLRWAPGRREDP